MGARKTGEIGAYIIKANFKGYFTYSTVFYQAPNMYSTVQVKVSTMKSRCNRGTHVCIHVPL